MNYLCNCFTYGVYPCRAVAAAAAVKGEGWRVKAVANAPLARPRWIATPLRAATKIKMLENAVNVL